MDFGRLPFLDFRGWHFESATNTTFFFFFSWQALRIKRVGTWRGMGEIAELEEKEHGSSLHPCTYVH
jgi:hypothetical protein